MGRAGPFLLSALVLGVSGCPVTDDYFLRTSETKASGGTDSSAGSSSGAPVGEPASAGADGTAAGGSAGDGGASVTSVGGAEAMPCVATGDERCDGRDNDCDGGIDEAACAGGCQGFVLEGQPEHGYVYCALAVGADWEDASDACLAAGMRLLWVESAAENDAVSAKLVELGADGEVTFGANDRDKEGDWRWGASAPFWRGGADGAALGDAFTAWTEGVPNDNGNEDCGVLYPETATWGDKACDQQFAYACEQPD